MASDIDDLRLFTRIVSGGSLSEAARRLNSSLPVMSRRLAAMEARLGTRLIERGPRRFVLTDEGSLLFERGMTILDQVDELETQVRIRTTGLTGHIRVGTPNQIGRQRFAPLIATFSRLYPQVTIELVLTDNRVDVVGDELDVGLHIDEPQDGNTVVRKILSSRRVICAAPAYLVANGVPEAPDDLLRHNCLCLVRGRHVFNTWSVAVGGSRRDVQVSGSLTSNSAEVLHGWARAGTGIVFKALWDIEEDLAAGHLVEVLREYRSDQMNLYATYPSKAYLPRRVRVFLDYLIAPALADPQTARPAEAPVHRAAGLHNA